MIKDLLTNTNGHFEWMKSNPLVITGDRRKFCVIDKV